MDDYWVFFNLTGYLFWPILLIGFIVFLRNPRQAWQNTTAFLKRIFRRSKTNHEE